MRMIAVLAFLSQGAGGDMDRAIETARQVVVREIDPTLPDLAFEEWLGDMSAVPEEIDWEVNDCGEQTGNPELDRGRDFPMCVTATAPVDDGQTLSVSLVVGTWGTGLSEAVPDFFFAVLLRADEPARYFRRLSEAASAVRGP